MEALIHQLPKPIAETKWEPETNSHHGSSENSENDIVMKKDEPEKDGGPMSFVDSIIKPLIVENAGVGRGLNDKHKMEIDHSDSAPLPTKRGKMDVDSVKNGSPSPSRIANNNNMKNPQGQGQPSPGQRAKVFTCPTCNRCFGYKHVLQNHERTHTGERPFECNICNRKFARCHHLTTHMRLHTGEKPYQCIHCGRRFVQVANLQRHLRVHTGERPYACQLCSSRFSSSSQLKAHMRIHKGTSPPQLLTPSRRAVGSDRGDASSTCSGRDSSNRKSTKRERKCRETRSRSIIGLDTLRLANPTDSSTPLTIPKKGSVVPEQDHPEDLSVGGGGGIIRSGNYSGSSSSVTASSAPSPRGGLLLRLGRYCSSSEETPDLFSDEDLRLRPADSRTFGHLLMISQVQALPTMTNVGWDFMYCNCRSNAY